MRDLASVSDAGILQFDEIPDAAVVAHRRGGTQAGKRSDGTALAHAGVGQDAALDSRPRPHKTVCDDAAARDLRVLADHAVPRDDGAPPHRRAPAEPNGDVHARALLDERAPFRVQPDTIPLRTRQTRRIVGKREEPLGRIAAFTERSAAFQIAASEAYAPRMDGKKLRELLRREEGIRGIEDKFFPRRERALRHLGIQRPAHAFETVFAEQVELVAPLSAEGEITAFQKIYFHIDYYIKTPHPFRTGAAKLQSGSCKTHTCMKIYVRSARSTARRYIR